jgi:hypothetical protein
MTLVAIMTVRRDAIDKFRSFESKAAAVMARHWRRNRANRRRIVA